mmetsp:Transcript_2083/g.2975  ORF Transcript_2083/g.2975 Transcript_2083/m.2975 type:complete len:231 (+) Transcript_2083:51-743(+)
MVPHTKKLFAFFLSFMLSKVTCASSFSQPAFCSSITKYGTRDCSINFLGRTPAVSTTRRVDKLKKQRDFVAHWQHVGLTKLAYSARYDNLVGGLAQISIGASLCVLWSEWSVITTGCGPLNISDFLERLCYQLDIVFAGSFWYSRIAFGCDITALLGGDEEGKDSIVPWGFELEDFTLLQVKSSELLAYASVIGALLALASQILNGSQMDGLSGIDIQQCRAMRDFRNLY